MPRIDLVVVNHRTGDALLVQPNLEQLQFDSMDINDALALVNAIGDLVEVVKQTHPPTIDGGEEE